MNWNIPNPIPPMRHCRNTGSPRPYARFMQADPLGYKDGPNMYTYVHGDPVNNIDPDGRTCVSLGEGKGYDCKLDDTGKFSKQEIAAANKAYTAAVNKLMHNPNKAVKVTLMGRSMTVKARDVAAGLIRAHVVAGENTGQRAMTQGGTLADGRGTQDGRPKITIDRRSLWSDRAGKTTNVSTDLRKTFIHEGIHTTNQQRVFAPLFNSDPAWFNSFHKRYYNEASSIFHDDYDQ